MKNYSFGKNLRELRRSKGLTQGGLASLLAISPQSVSKWENDIGYPDLSLLVPISGIFGVTVDYLLGNGENTKESDIEAAKERTNAFWLDEEKDTSDECITVWRELLKKYPADNECRNALAFELRSGCKCLPPDERRTRALEAAALYETVLDESKDSEERSFARSELVYIYSLIGELELAEKHAKKAGSIYCNMPHLMTSIEGHPERKHWQQYEVWYMTCGLAFAIAGQSYKTAEEAVFAYRTALKLIDTVCNGSSYPYFDSYFSAYFLREICRRRAEVGDFDDSIYGDIKAMLDSCRRADSESLGRHYFDGNPFMDSVYYDRTLPSDELKWAMDLLDGPLFDKIRNTEKFGKTVKPE